MHKIMNESFKNNIMKGTKGLTLSVHKFCRQQLHALRKSRLPGINYTVQHSSFKFCIAEQSGQSNIPVLRLLLLNMKCHYYYKGLHFVIKLTS